MAEEHLLYGDLQLRGEMRQSWMEKPTSTREQECPIPKSNLKLDDLKEVHGFVVTDEGVPYVTGELEDTTEDYMLIKAPKSSEWRRVYRVKVDHDVKDSEDSKDYEFALFEGHISRGIIFIESVYRRPGAGVEAGPPCSQIAQAAYEATYPIESLKHIIVADVVNKLTKRFIKSLYAEEAGIMWKDEELFEWKYDTPKFKAILGTKIGSIAAYIVLGSFAPGTHHIARIKTTFNYNTLYMRFDIEPIRTRPGITPETSTSNKKKRRRDDVEDLWVVEDGSSKKLRYDYY